MPNISVIIQARMGSTRLPGKVLKDLIGKPMLTHVIERVRYSKKVNQIIVATTIDQGDEAIEKYCAKIKVNCFRGSENDVLDRFYQAALKFKADVVIRVTGDCPLIDPEVIDKVVQYYLDHEYDYVSNVHPPTYPDGLDVEVFSFASLKKMWVEAKKTSEREHVTPYIYNNTNIFRMGNVANDEDLSDLRLTVDTQEDFQVTAEIFNALYSKKKIFLLKDVLNFMVKNPQISKINAKFTRNEGYLKSILEDDKKPPKT